MDYDLSGNGSISNKKGFIRDAISNMMMY